MTDAMSAMGLSGRRFSLGQGTVEVVGGAARLAGTNTLAGRWGWASFGICTAMVKLHIGSPLPQCGDHGPVRTSFHESHQLLEERGSAGCLQAPGGGAAAAEQ